MVSLDLTKTKEVAHKWRRMARTVEFRPYDELIAKQIPGQDAVAAEAKRQEIRDKYATLQTQIDAASDPDSVVSLTPTKQDIYNLMENGG